MNAAQIKRRKGLSGTFALNKSEPIHRWYKYDEGYSSEFIINEFTKLPIEAKTIFEPFGGSGTTPLVASQLGIESFFTEINPFMAYVTETKINTVREISRNRVDSINSLTNLLEAVDQKNINMNILPNFDGFEKYFKEDVLIKLLALKDLIKNICTEPIASIAMLGLASITVTVSNMIKRGDVRYAKDNEKKPEDFDVFHQFTNKVKAIINDIANFSDTVQSKTSFISSDARKAELPLEVDCVITSPPYLNGTNYIRNTKLELKLLDFIKTEKDLPLLHSNGIMAGINSVSKRRTIPYIMDEVKEYVDTLEPVAYDKRIPIMVAGYFYDMDVVFSKLKTLIRNEGVFILDIGDSQFAGVHIPTDILLSKIARKHGFEQYDEEILRTRRSKNQMLLSQKVLRYKLRK
ncbi:site-specific DNA-methyltransferase [Bacillus altitudinis]|uniref:site-specific DNA-methyltransferase n=1 Tax=Bacillus altitudinis TaxID=293387 RepID=UPI00110E20F7|nr:site-specific DNA-methyltransferase [Bacillus altitudinis]